MVVSYELRLQLDYDILARVRNQDWDLSALPPGFIIQFGEDHIRRLYRQPNRPINPTNRLPRKFVFKEESFFLSHQGVRHFLSNILYGQNVPISPNGRILCDGGLQLLRLDSTGLVMLSQPSLPVYTVKKFVDCVIQTCKLMKNSPWVRKLVPVAIDIQVIRYQHSVAFHGIKTAEEVEALVAEEKIEDSCQEKDCSICLEQLCVGQGAGRMSCTHIFHKYCIVHWLQKRSSCPLCRAPADLLPSPNVPAGVD